jgi:uncharacterized membrane protein/protein-disulfide isomerase
MIWPINGMISDSSLKKQVQALPYCVYFGAVLALCLAGLAVSIYLAITHYRIHTETGYQSFCALSKAINCDSVSESPYSVMWGLPLAVWGVAGYSFLLILVSLAGLRSAERRRVWTLSLSTVFGFSLCSLIFAGISAFKIGSYCILCIATYGINFFLVYMGWITRRRFHVEPFPSAWIEDMRFLWSKRRVSVPIFTLFGVGLLLTRLLFPAYWDGQPPAAMLHARTGVTADGHPWIGAENPQLEIVEFTDYQCFQCKKMNSYLRQLVARNPEEIRLVHRNYPMDHEFNPIVTEPFHVGSGRMALLAVHAAANGMFLEINDLLYYKATTGDPIRIAEIAAETGMDSELLSGALQHEPYRRHLLRDIRDGMKLGVVGTPSYLINGRVYEGHIPEEILKSLLKLEVASSD